MWPAPFFSFFTMFHQLFHHEHWEQNEILDCLSWAASHGVSPAVSSCAHAHRLDDLTYCDGVHLCLRQAAVQSLADRYLCHCHIGCQWAVACTYQKKSPNAWSLLMHACRSHDTKPVDIGLYHTVPYRCTYRHTGLPFDLTDRNMMMDTTQFAAVYVLQLVDLSGTMHTYH